MIRNFIIKVLVVFLEWVLKPVPDFGSLASIRPKQTTFIKNIAKLIEYAHTLPGYELTGGEFWRTKEQQAIYFSKGLSKTMNSRHMDRLAFDINIFINGQLRQDKAAYRPLAEYWKTLHPDNVSGYDWNWDFNHFQMS